MDILMKGIRCTLHPCVCGTLGGAFSYAVSKGCGGSAPAFTLVDAVLSGMQTGAQLASFPLATQCLAAVSPTFRRNVDDPNGNKVMVYGLGGAGAAVFFSAFAYPIRTRMAAQQSGKKCKVSLKGYCSFYIDQVPVSIGFPATIEYLMTHVPASSNTFVTWARTHFCINMSNISARLLACPVHYIRHGTPASRVLMQYIANIPNVMVTSDAVSHFRKLI